MPQTARPATAARSTACPGTDHSDPADGTGGHLVGRSHDGEPWSAVIFGQLADGMPFLYSSGQISPRAG